MNGAFFLHRKLLDSPIFNDLHLLRFWIYCLSKASHKKHEQMVGRQLVKLDEGQFITGRIALKNEYNRGLSEKEQKSDKTLWNWLLLLQSMGNVSIKSTTKYSVVSIENWTLYQKDLVKSSQQTSQQTSQQSSNKVPTKFEQISTNNNDNNDNNVNNENNDNNKDIVVTKVTPKRTNKKNEYDPEKYKTRKKDLLLFEDDVYMTSEEYDKLVNKYGKGKTDYMINYYNSYVIQEGYREDKESKNDYIGVNKWIAGGYGNYKENKNNLNLQSKQDKSIDAIMSFSPNSNNLIYGGNNND